MIEELHHPLKSAIKCHATERWTEVLPIILLGLRASLKEDILCTPAELVLGTTIRLPGEMFDSSKPDDDVVNFVSKVKSHMHNHFTLNHQNTMANVQFLSIQDCWKQHMFFFVDTCYVVHFNNPMMALSKCKPAFFLNTEDLQLPQTKNETPATVEPNATASTPATVESDPTASTPTQPSTRSGRKVHLPTRYR
ncbi:RT_RNaseH domain-containing protein [Trichonephila clavipes]|uniref:RT_RNaseH domain-containing protein n=1 Tax=Trichonephila clavipes TaxID=2585209 RepID=A0A8X6SQV2_TRICX|nr:RT_RNaseH domain-containing protein [Trichonephila clavipes]